MWNAEIINKDIDVTNQIIVVLVRFTTTGRAFDKKLSFGHAVTLAEVKRRIKQEIERLEAADTNDDQITVGVVDLSGVTSSETPTQAEIDKAVWFRNFERLQKAQKLVDLGVTLTAGQTTALNTLRATVSTDFKTTYFNDM